MNLSSAQLQLPGVLVLELAGTDSDGAPLVWLAEGDDPQPVQVVWMRDVPDWKACAGKRVVVAMQDGGGPPVLLGLLDPPSSNTEEGGPRKTEKCAPRKLHIESEEELVIECGKAKIAMRADGRIEIRGGHLISRSSGPNKIKGRSVHIN